MYIHIQSIYLQVVKTYKKILQIKTILHGTCYYIPIISLFFNAYMLYVHGFRNSENCTDLQYTICK